MKADCIDILTELESWYARENGQYLLESTRKAVQESLDTSFGYHILQLGVTGGRPLCHSSPINHRIYVADRPGEGHWRGPNGGPQRQMPGGEEHHCGCQADGSRVRPAGWCAQRDQLPLA